MEYMEQQMQMRMEGAEMELDDMIDEIARLHAELERREKLLTSCMMQRTEYQTRADQWQTIAEELAALLVDPIETESEFWTVWDQQATEALTRYQSLKEAQA